MSSVDDIFSELEDPVQEESILKELFYNRSVSKNTFPNIMTASLINQKCIHIMRSRLCTG